MSNEPSTSDRYRFVLDESPCPVCEVPGFPIQVWHEGEQMMQCDSEDCRVEEYRMIQPGGGNE